MSDEKSGHSLKNGWNCFSWFLRNYWFLCSVVPSMGRQCCLSCHFPLFRASCPSPSCHHHHHLLLLLLFHHCWCNHYSVYGCTSKVIFKFSCFGLYCYHLVLCNLYCCRYIRDLAFAHCNSGCASYCGSIHAAIKHCVSGLGEIRYLMIVHS